MMSRFDLVPTFWDHFWSAVNKSARWNPRIGRCWEWVRGKTKAGYGQLQCRIICQAPLLAHRVSWELWTGNNPGKSHVLHKCDNPACVRPSHLFLGGQVENNLDRDRKGRTAKGDRNGARTMRSRNPFVRNRGSGQTGERHPMAKLSDAQVESLIYEYAASGKRRGVKSALARKHKITLTHVSRLVKNGGRH